MRKLFTYLLLLTAITATTQVQAQYCGASEVSTSACGLPPSFPGFPNLDSIPCIQQGVFTSIIIPFKNYTQFTAQGHTVPVDRLQIDSVNNLPCGMCWSTNKSDNSFYAGDFGCFRIQGITNDPVGQYKTRLYVNVNYVDTSTNYNIDTLNADEGGIYLYVRVVAAGATTCTPVDTSSTGQRLQSTCDTFNVSAGIRTISAALRDLSIQPNPMSSEAKVTFTSEYAGTQQLRIVNIIGSEVYSTTITAKPGINETTINRNDLPTGMYILSVGSNQGTATRKFVITE